MTATRPTAGIVPRAGVVAAEVAVGVGSVVLRMSKSRVRLWRRIQVPMKVLFPPLMHSRLLPAAIVGPAGDARVAVVRVAEDVGMAVAPSRVAESRLSGVSARPSRLPASLTTRR